MKEFKFASCEYCFPVWGSLAVEMAAEAGRSQTWDKAHGYIFISAGESGIY